MVDTSTFVAPVQKGERPLTASQFASRITDRKRRVLSDTAEAVLLATNPAGAKQMAGVMQALLSEAALNNLFNHQVAEYHAALARLSEMQLSKGQPERFEDQETGQFDDEGQPIIASVLVQKYIAPLDATVEEPRFDEDTGEALDPETVPNPAIVKDNAERAAALAVIDGTPQAVKDWATP